MKPPYLPASPTAAEQRARAADRLVAAARGGDARAFDDLVRRFRPRIFALALHLTGSQSDADDIAQDAFVQAYRHIQHFEGRSQFFTWLYRITVNRALNVERQRTRRGSLPLDDVRVEVALKYDAPSDPRLALELRETYAALLTALDALSPSLKSAVVLTSLQGLSYEEAAVVLGTSAGAIAVRIHEARKQLRAALASRQGTAKNKELTSSGERARPDVSDDPRGQAFDLALALASVI